MVLCPAPTKSDLALIFLRLGDKYRNFAIGKCSVDSIHAGIFAQYTFLTDAPDKSSLKYEHSRINAVHSDC